MLIFLAGKRPRKCVRDGVQRDTAPAALRPQSSVRLSRSAVISASRADLWRPQIRALREGWRRQGGSAEGMQPDTPKAGKGPASEE